MNKILKKTAVVAIAGAMAFGMRVNLYAATDSKLNTSTEGIADTGTINLLKDYQKGNTYDQSNSPAETFTFTITRYGLWNVGEDGNGQAKYKKDDMPTFSNGATTGAANTFTIDSAPGAAGTQNELVKALTVPKYEAVGDYWYQVSETNNNVLGVFYGTNDSQSEDTKAANGNHNAVYYIHVQVTNATAKGQYIRTVTLHKTAPNLETTTTNESYENWYKDNNKNIGNQNDKKVNDIQNKYYAGALNITKTVSGNAGDKNELFKVTVTFENSSGKSMNSTITYKNFYDNAGKLTGDATAIDWTDNATEKSVEFYVKDGTTVTFDNLPYGVTYTVEETQPDDDKYTHEFAFTDSKDGETIFDGKTLAADTVTAEATTGTNAEKWKAAKATGSISDESDTVTITNTKTSTIDIGVFTTNAPYIAMLILAAGATIVFVRRKSRIEE